MLRNAVTCCLAMIAFAGSASAMQRDDHSTYVPGHNAPAQPYSLRGSATQPDGARGGGPQSNSPAVRHVPTHRHMPRIQSDNQTRRPGAANYTGPSFKSDADRSAHRIPAPQPESVAGDHSAARTGAHNHGPIPVRATSSNEDDYRKAHQHGEALGGGPRPGVVVPPRSPR